MGERIQNPILVIFNGFLLTRIAWWSVKDFAYLKRGNGDMFGQKGRYKYKRKDSNWVLVDIICKTYTIISDNS